MNKIIIKKITSQHAVPTSKTPFFSVKDRLINSCGLKHTHTHSHDRQSTQSLQQMPSTRTCTDAQHAYKPRCELRLLLLYEGWLCVMVVMQHSSAHREEAGIDKALPVGKLYTTSRSSRGFLQ